MKYKELVLEKIERVENTRKNLEYYLNRNEIVNARQATEKLKNQINSIREQISIEQN